VYAIPLTPHSIREWLKEQQPLRSNSFTPAPLPCKYHIYGKNNFYDKGNLTDTVHHDYYVNGDNYRYHAYDAHSDLVFMVRKEGDDNYRHYYETNATESCLSEKLTDGQAKSAVDAYFGFFTEPVPYDKEMDGFFEGEKCKVYFISTGDSKIYFYVDAEQVIVGFVYVLPGDSFQTIRYSYDEDVSKSDFVMNSDHKGCDDSAYKNPDSGLCSAAGMVTVVKSAIFMMIALAVYSLF